VTSREMDWTGLKLLLEGIVPKLVKKRYRHGEIDVEIPSGSL
jgi:hypothetical protein